MLPTIIGIAVVCYHGQLLVERVTRPPDLNLPSSVTSSKLTFLGTDFKCKDSERLKVKGKKTIYYENTNQKEMA
jgi:hypothetical protein